MNNSKINNLIDLTIKLMKNVTINNLIAHMNEDKGQEYIEGYNMGILENKYHYKRNDKRKIFFMLMELSKELLTIKNGVPLSKYKYLAQWRKYNIYLEEDLLIVANIVYEDFYYGGKTEKFNWKLIIDHDNDELNKILERGLSDNHYHLWGSVPLFKCAWTYYMNNVDKVVGLTFLKSSQEENIPVLLIQAALIRLYLFYQSDQNTTNEDVDEKREKQKNILCFLENINELVEKRMQIQEAINYLKTNKDLFGENIEYQDYIYYNKENTSDNLYEDYFSERKFLYDIMFKIVNSDSIGIECINMLHIYLAIKEKVRGTIVQCIDDRGFESFYKINANKNNIINLYDNPKKLLYPYIKNEIDLNNIVRLEIRIKIQESSCMMVNYINQLDELIDPCGKYRDIIKYIVCFSRKQEVMGSDDEFYRDFHKRIYIQNQSEILKEFFKKYNTISKRVVGLDVCSSELNFKPEVFVNILNRSDSISQDSLKRTYHVGEEYNDFLDGLRSIDECVSFLNLKKGDRLGHALPLGINIYNWYKRNGYLINTSKEQYLDNIVWIYFKIKDNEKYKDVIDIILKEFNEIFKDIYVSNNAKSVLQKFFDVKNFRGLVEKLEKVKFDCFTIQDYFYSWQMRKRTPQAIVRDLYDALRGVNHIGKLNSLFITVNYFFNSKTKELGKELISVKVSESMLDIINEIQKQVQHEVKAKGINIEICPSSNVIIGSAEGYLYHPLINIYSEGLISRNKQVNSAKISISINTDDQSIFCTSLRNEYSLMANALEMARDESGTKLYDKRSVYKWIDNIRKNGVRMSF